MRIHLGAGHRRWKGSSRCLQVWLHVESDTDLMDPSGNHDIGTRTTVRWKGNEARELFIQITTNVSLYTRNRSELHFLLRGSSKDKRLFLVSNEIMAGFEWLFIARLGNCSFAAQKACVEYYNRVKLTYDSLLRQKSSLPTITLDASVTKQHLREIGGQKWDPEIGWVLD